MQRLMSCVTEPASQGEDLTLHSPEPCEVVRAHEGNLHDEPPVASLSLGQLGWNKCHCSGDSLMMASSA